MDFRQTRHVHGYCWNLIGQMGKVHQLLSELSALHTILAGYYRFTYLFKFTMLGKYWVTVYYRWPHCFSVLCHVYACDKILGRYSNCTKKWQPVCANLPTELIPLLPGLSVLLHAYMYAVELFWWKISSWVLCHLAFNGVLIYVFNVIISFYVIQSLPGGTRELISWLVFPEHLHI